MAAERPDDPKKGFDLPPNPQRRADASFPLRTREVSAKSNAIFGGSSSYLIVESMSELSRPPPDQYKLIYTCLLASPGAFASVQIIERTCGGGPPPHIPSGALPSCKWR